MKKWFIIIILLFSLFSCEKDKTSTLKPKHSKQEILSAIVGTWKFNRLAYDPEFKNIIKIESGKCDIDAYTTFTKQETFISRMYYTKCDSVKITEKGGFAIVIQENSDVFIWPLEGGFALTPRVWYHGQRPLYHFTDSTLVFSEAVYYPIDEAEDDKYHLYTELKRAR